MVHASEILLFLCLFFYVAVKISLFCIPVTHKPWVAAHSYRKYSPDYVLHEVSSTKQTFQNTFKKKNINIQFYIMKWAEHMDTGVTLLHV